MMAMEYGMIEPYEPGQVKEVDGKRIVSYGTSSYGYDIRCADEFKLFTNINSTIVDPKEFDDEELRRTSKATQSSFRQTVSPSRARSNTSASRATF